MPEPFRVLIVDDDEHIRRLLAVIVARAGLEAHVAGDGAEALRMLWDGLVPDVVVTDVEMPVVDGLELAALIRGMDALRHTIVIVHTGRSPEGEERRLADAWIRKGRIDVLAGLLEALRDAPPPADHPG